MFKLSSTLNFHKKNTKSTVSSLKRLVQSFFKFLIEAKLPTFARELESVMSSDCCESIKLPFAS
jgi:hypothetical protein